MIPAKPKRTAAARGRGGTVAVTPTLSKRTAMVAPSAYDGVFEVPRDGPKDAIRAAMAANIVITTAQAVRAVWEQADAQARQMPKEADGTCYRLRATRREDGRLAFIICRVHESGLCLTPSDDLYVGKARRVGLLRRIGRWIRKRILRR